MLPRLSTKKKQKRFLKHFKFWEWGYILSFMSKISKTKQQKLLVSQLWQTLDEEYLKSNSVTILEFKKHSYKLFLEYLTSLSTIQRTVLSNLLTVFAYDYYLLPYEKPNKTDEFFCEMIEVTYFLDDNHLYIEAAAEALSKNLIKWWD